MARLPRMVLPAIPHHDDDVVTVDPALERIGDLRTFLSEAFDEAFAYAALRKAEMIGAPSAQLNG